MERRGDSERMWSNIGILRGFYTSQANAADRAWKGNAMLRERGGMVRIASAAPRNNGNPPILSAVPCAGGCRLLLYL